MDIPIQSEGIAALAQYWDNELRCSAFPDFHPSLVIEEYASFLGRPLGQKSTVYTYPGGPPSCRAIAQLLGRGNPNDKTGANAVIRRLRMCSMENIRK